MFKFFPFRPFEEVKFSTEGLTKEFLENNNIPTKNLLFSKYHLPYNPNLKQFSRNLRNVSQLAEILLWNELKADKFLGLSFNRQKPILNYIADFYCKEKGVVIEIDGASHFSEEAMQYDAERDRQMKVLGLKVIRVADKDVRKNRAGVLEEIARFITREITPPNPQEEITPPNPQEEITPPNPQEEITPPNPQQEITPPNPLKEGERNEGGYFSPLKRGPGGLNALFNEQKYKGLLEGLEVVEIKYNALENIIDYRIESEYFDKRFLNNEKLLRKNSIPFFEVANYDNGRAYASDKFSELNLWENRSVKVAKIGDVTQKRFIEQWENLELEEFIFQKGELLKVDDILMSLTGDPPDVGKVSLIFEVPCNATWNQRVAKVYLRDEQTVFISNRVFFVILSTKYCREQLERYAKGIRQRNLGTECLQEMKVPVISNSFQEVIEKTIQTYYLKIQQSKVLYTEAENILLQELGLSNWQPTIKNNNTKTLKESFLSSGRIDAEYYQPKYDEVENIIKEYKDGWSTIGNSLLEINTGDFCNEYHEKAEGLTFYIRNTNISKGRIVEDEKYFVSTNGLTKFTKEGDILTARVGAIGSFGTVNKKFENSIYSDNVLCLRLHHNLLPDVYTCYLNSNINAELMEKIAGGSVQPLITQTSIKDLVIPIFPNNIQKVVSEKMQQSFKLQAQSKELLEAAKRAVEIAIEQSEQAALEFLNNY